MRTRATGTLIKFTIFGVVMAVLTAFLFFIFGQVRTGATNGYSAVFADASRLEAGDTVRVAGIRVGTVKEVSLEKDRTVLVDFDADRSIVLTTGTKAQIRYLNLVGDRYLELVDTPGSTKILPVGSQIPEDRTAPALDLDLLLGGLKPVIQGLNPQDVNALSASLIQVLQGQGGTLDSLFSKSSSFTNALADNNQVIEQLIDRKSTRLNSSHVEMSYAVFCLKKKLSCRRRRHPKSPSSPITQWLAEMGIRTKVRAWTAVHSIPRRTIRQ